MEFIIGTANGNLDRILMFLNIRGGEEISVIEITSHLIVQPATAENHMPEVRSMLDYLVDEKYARHNQNTNDFSITFRGKKFIEDGGYLSQENEKNARQAWEDEILLRGIENGKRLNDLTMGLMIATILLFLLEFVKFYISLPPSHECH